MAKCIICQSFPIYCLMMCSRKHIETHKLEIMCFACKYFTFHWCCKFCSFGTKGYFRQAPVVVVAHCSHQGASSLLLQSPAGGCCGKDGMSQTTCGHQQGWTSAGHLSSYKCLMIIMILIEMVSSNLHCQKLKQILMHVHLHKIIQ